MPREPFPEQATQKAHDIVDGAQTLLTVDLVAELAEPLTRYMLVSYYSDEHWRDSPQLEALARAAAVLEADGREVPVTILEALKKAAEAGRLVGLA